MDLPFLQLLVAPIDLRLACLQGGLAVLPLQFFALKLRLSLVQLCTRLLKFLLRVFRIRSGFCWGGG